MVYRSMDIGWQLDHLPMLPLLQGGFQILAIVANSGINFDVPMSFSMDPSLLQPLSMQIPQQLPSTLRRVNSSRILHRRKLFIPQGLKKPKSFTFLKDIKIEQLKFNAIILLRLDALLCGRIVMFYFLLSQMVLLVYFLDQLRGSCYFLDEIRCDQDCCSVPMAVSEIAVLVSLFGQGFRHLAVLADIHFTIVEHVNAEFLFGVSLLDVSRDDFETVLHHEADTSGVGQLQQDVINGRNIDILDPMLPHMLDRSFILHLNIHRPIATRRQGQIPLRLNHNLAIVINSRDSTLREEEDTLRVVTEVFVLFEEVHDLFMVHVAGHYVPFYHVQLCQF